MIMILPLRDREALNKLNEREQLACSNAYCLMDGKEIAAYVLYDMHEDHGVLVALGGEYDASIADGLCRAALASLSDIGINRAYVSGQVAQALGTQFALTKNGSNEIPSVLAVLHHCEGCNGDCTTCSTCAK